ncbi:MAG: Rieske 2Fe-2S domain-containing protein [Chlamydiales bacterium]|nr:Rieske 2Fe-2S domain-containing protein [Chlamydiia bacterium]MCP5506988.1 Rieske 2Fe-2S domain-containing protein [Chlamydiales bacterium]
MLIKIAATEDIPEGKSLVVNIPDGREIAIFHINGQFYALNNCCPHEGGPLGEGDVEGCQVTCPWHAWEFDIKTGSCSTFGGEDAETINILVQGGEIFLAE